MSVNYRGHGENLQQKACLLIKDKIAHYTQDLKDYMKIRVFVTSIELLEIKV
jgi:hypothetical protein